MPAMMRWIAAVSLAWTASCASAPSVQSAVSVDLVQGEMIELWGVTGWRTTDGLVVSGNAKQRLVPKNELLDEHLHAEAIGSDGQILETRDVSWNSLASLRTRDRATFRTHFDTAMSAAISRVRMAVVAGRVHRDA
jgi:hypothetical protein